MNWTPKYAYAYPNDADPKVREVKRLAAKVGRAHQQADKFEQHKTKLREFMQTLDKERLEYWAKVVMLDSRFCGATGTGAYWAVASKQVNDIAKELLHERDCDFRLEVVAQFRDRPEPLKAEELKTVQEQVDAKAKAKSKPKPKAKPKRTKKAATGKKENLEAEGFEPVQQSAIDLGSNESE